MLSRLKEFNAQIRMRSPDFPSMASSEYGVMHVKQWVFDERILWVGSAACTGNSMRSCEEVMMLDRTVKNVEGAVEQFRESWANSLEIPYKWIYESDCVFRGESSSSTGGDGATSACTPGSAGTQVGLKFRHSASARVDGVTGAGSNLGYAGNRAMPPSRERAV